MVDLRMATLDDSTPFFDHLIRHFRESGQGSDIIFHPSPDFESWDRSAFIENLKRKWALPLEEPGWERAWLAFENGLLLGHSILRGGRILAELHRTRFSIGIERPLRSRGIGKKLTQVALEWAKAQPQLDWIDLDAFGHNQVAQSLYRSLGFRETGRTEDCFRLMGVKIDDIHFTLKLR